MSDRPPVSSTVAESVVHDLDEACRARDLTLYPSSVIGAGGGWLALARSAGRRRLLAVEPAAAVSGFEGTPTPIDIGGARHIITIGDCTATNARTVRAAVPTLAPRAFGLRRSAGCGDRLGLATPGHIRAFRSSTLA